MIGSGVVADAAAPSPCPALSWSSLALPAPASATAVSPYAAVLDVLGVPAVATVMNAIVLTAVLSCLNSALYTSSRMLFALTRNGDAPRAFTRLSGSGVPHRAILAGTVVG
jgi:GABA permease